MESQLVTDWQKLETVCLTGCCPLCGSDESVTAIEYEFDREVWFECEICKWEQTFDLLDAKEAGYYCSYGREDITDE